MLATPDDDPYLMHRDVVESIIRFVCRRRGLRGDDADEFAAEVRLRLVQSNGLILRKFEGRATIQTYLAVVIGHWALDYQAARWGRWRPTIRARRGGPAAVRLEQLVVRDGKPVAEALTLVEREFASVERRALESFAESLSPRPRRQAVGEDALEDVATSDPDPEHALLAKERCERFARATGLLASFVDALPPADRLVVQMRFEQRMTVADIARVLQRDQKRLYRDIERVLAEAKRLLEREGIDAATVRDLLEDL